MQKKAKILVVDDNVSIIRTMSLVLARKGYDVATASDGNEALEKVRESAFDLIFMDVKMPLMDGVETYRRIKEIQPEASVVMMTAYAVEDLVQEALREGAYGILYKPLDLDRVLSIIDEARETKKSALVLVVDDDPSICTTLKNILARKSYEVMVANSGEEAISIVREQSPDILLIDMKMPVLNGLVTYLAIKEIAPETVAIIMTAHRQEMGDLIQSALENSAFACLYKPLDIEVMLGMIEEIMRKRKSMSPSEE